MLVSPQLHSVEECYSVHIVHFSAGHLWQIFLSVMTKSIEHQHFRSFTHQMGIKRIPASWKPKRKQTKPYHQLYQKVQLPSAPHTILSQSEKSLPFPPFIS